MRPTFLLLLTLLAGCREGHLQEVTKCGQPCYTLGGKVDVGPCARGHWACDGADESTAVCEGQTGPQPDGCDGIDNDCNGEIDDGDESLPGLCSSVCGMGWNICQQGAWHCSARQPTPEVCDGRDNDCDGKVDEPEDLPPPEPCYDAGTPETLQYGDCHPGSTRCVFGALTCVNQKGPTPETCDGVDNNCNGQVDEGTGNHQPVDFAFLVDCSGSMSGTITAVQSAVDTFSTTYSSRTDIRWALIGVPDPNIAHDATVTLMCPLGATTPFAQAVSTLSANGGGQEPTLDGVWDLTVASNPLHMSWTPGSKHVLILFTDENPQSYLVPVNTFVESDAALAASGAELHIFTTVQGQFDWTGVGSSTQVFFHPLTSLPAVMEMALASIIMETTCR